MTIEGTRYDAVLVEAAELSSDRAVLMAMHYMPLSDTTQFKDVGNVSLVEHRDNLIGPEDKA